MLDLYMVGILKVSFQSCFVLISPMQHMRILASLNLWIALNIVILLSTANKQFNTMIQKFRLLYCPLAHMTMP